MENSEEIKDYIINDKLDIDTVIDKFYNYIYIIVKNSVSIVISDEDIEEIISDTFIALWKNSNYLLRGTKIKPYLRGTAQNVIKNKYRTTQINISILDYENDLIDGTNIERIIEENEQNRIIKETLRNMKNEEYKIFIMFYYEAKKIKEIAQILNISESKVKVILHRIRKIIKKNLKNGGYSYNE